MSDIKAECIGSDVSFSDSECDEIYTVPINFEVLSRMKHLINLQYKRKSCVTKMKLIFA